MGRAAFARAATERGVDFDDFDDFDDEDDDAEHDDARAMETETETETDGVIVSVPRRARAASTNARWCVETGGTGRFGYASDFTTDDGDENVENGWITSWRYGWCATSSRATSLRTDRDESMLLGQARRRRRVAVAVGYKQDRAPRT